MCKHCGAPVSRPALGIRFPRHARLVYQSRRRGCSFRQSRRGRRRSGGSVRMRPSGVTTRSCLPEIHPSGFMPTWTAGHFPSQSTTISLLRKVGAMTSMLWAIAWVALGCLVSLIYYAIRGSKFLHPAPRILYCESFVFGRSPFSKCRYSSISPRVSAAPNPWLLCMLRLRPAISV